MNKIPLNRYTRISVILFGIGLFLYASVVLWGQIWAPIFGPDIGGAQPLFLGILSEGLLVDIVFIFISSVLALGTMDSTKEKGRVLSWIFALLFGIGTIWVAGLIYVSWALSGMVT
ncbi:hypothetical protein A3D71_04170 [Candidatus Kaiserbacteria bacterium RIFCSPHIGHO2_02_FULL_55_20]|uniref:Uncharacterized protein n=1 Tax=Candidatus Kaiserbacteria bacterium RIFCSPHIGHO2_02_FULL_55_20 TaxID=1798497 RepID=A0A1F6DYN5_9BACT|nr:MAG: hypothetical protein A2680_03345 [Candidatus Kaiserbacteria bacterium RIFCSPHIGHO2_01_FULL_55_37]OGG66506.1 MAG: hypothetical protein A3D71_04170 [Candidatus Kaiserbacteria bacterium RIFCSPHIGHO2_02_FULL_55_20]